MSKPPRRRPNYDRKLARPLTLDDGKRLVTLRDAADVLQARFSTVTKWGAHGQAIEQLIEAAELGGRERVKAATDRIEIVLRGSRLL